MVIHYCLRCRSLHKLQSHQRFYIMTTGFTYLQGVRYNIILCEGDDSNEDCLQTVSHYAGQVQETNR
ncbi:hypothetical protein D3C75_232750 [compost metagenome]